MTSSTAPSKATKTDTGSAHPGGAARSLDHGTAPERFARGWHCLGPGDRSSTTASRTAIEGFGGKLVVWQGADGELNVLDGYCRHMGGDLTQGDRQGRRDRLPVPRLALGRRRQVQGDPLRAADPAARAHPEVRDGRAQRPADGLARHRGQPGRPRRPAARARRASWTPTSYTDWNWNVLDVPTAHCREIIDNVVDMAHFFYIHFAFPTSFRNVFEGHMATQFMESTGRPDMTGEGYGDEDLVLKSEATYYGPSFMINWLKNDYKGFVTDVVLINCHVPTRPQLVQADVRPEGAQARGHRREDDRLHRQALHRDVRRAASCRTCTSG